MQVLGIFGVPKPSDAVGNVRLIVSSGTEPASAETPGLCPNDSGAVLFPLNRRTGRRGLSIVREASGWLMLGADGERLKGPAVEKVPLRGSRDRPPRVSRSTGP